MTDTIGPEGERAIQYQSVALFTKGWYYSAGISVTNCLRACIYRHCDMQAGLISPDVGTKLLGVSSAGGQNI